MNALVILAAMLGLPAVQDTPPTPAEDTKPIIVTAKRLDVTANALAACIARRCPPDQEIDAALAHAENLFVEGDYFNARRTLMKTIGHVDKYAKNYPEQVGDIWRAQARIAQHMGEKEQTRSGQFQSLDALRKGLAKDDSRVFGQRIDVAEMLARQGRVDLAIDSYRNIAKGAKQAKQPYVEGTALIRVALLEASRYELEPNAFGVELNRAIDDILGTTDPALSVYRDAAKLLRARLAVKSDDAAAINALVTQYSPPPTNRPILIYQPRPAIIQEGARGVDGRPGHALSNAAFENQWVDVSFRIRPDGHVEDVEIARQASNASTDWVKPTLVQIAGRRYAPMTLPASSRQLRRVERYTLTGYWETPTGSRIRTRGYPRIEMLDLSVEPSATAGSTPTPAAGGSAVAPNSTPAD